MSNDALPQSAAYLEFDCLNPNCPISGKGRKMRVAAIAPEIANSPTVALVVFKHAPGVTCDYCNTYYSIVMVGAQTMGNWNVVPTERPSAIIIPPLGSRLT